MHAGRSTHTHRHGRALRNHVCCRRCCRCCCCCCCRAGYTRMYSSVELEVGWGDCQLSMRQAHTCSSPLPRALWLRALWLHALPPPPLCGHPHCRRPAHKTRALDAATRTPRHTHTHTRARARAQEYARKKHAGKVWFERHLAAALSSVEAKRQRRRQDRETDKAAALAAVRQYGALVLGWLLRWRAPRCTVVCGAPRGGGTHRHDSTAQHSTAQHSTAHRRHSTARASCGLLNTTTTHPTTHTHTHTRARSDARHGAGDGAVRRHQPARRGAHTGVLRWVCACVRACGRAWVFCVLCRAVQQCDVRPAPAPAPAQPYAAAQPHHTTHTHTPTHTHNNNNNNTDHAVPGRHARAGRPARLCLRGARPRQRIAGASPCRGAVAHAQLLLLLLPAAATHAGTCHQNARTRTHAHTHTHIHTHAHTRTLALDRPAGTSTAPPRRASQRWRTRRAPRRTRRSRAACATNTCRACRGGMRATCRACPARPSSAAGSFGRRSCASR
jgi:hypothetical protein